MGDGDGLSVLSTPREESNLAEDGRSGDGPSEDACHAFSPFWSPLPVVSNIDAILGMSTEGAVAEEGDEDEAWSLMQGLVWCRF